MQRLEHARDRAHSLTDIRELPIDTPRGGTCGWAMSPTCAIAPTPNVIEREDVSRRIDVGANVEGRDLGSVVGRRRARARRTSSSRAGYHAELLGEYAERQAAQSRLLLFAVAAAIGDLPAAAGGLRELAAGDCCPSSRCRWPWSAACWRRYLSGGTLSLGSLVGFLTVFGIAARNGILLINHYQHLERDEGEPFGPELVLRGARERLSPILMTALATGLALVPLVVAGNIPGHEIEHPMAVVILGGLVTSTLLNLFLVPSLYLRFGRGRYLTPQRELVKGASTPAPAAGLLPAVAEAVCQWRRRGVGSRLRSIPCTWPT